MTRGLLTRSGMNFSTDRDLLTIEPLVFRDVPMMSQQRLTMTDGVITGLNLTSSTADFQEAQVDTGGVVLIDGEAHEVTQRIDGSTLEVSRLRTHLSDTPIPIADGSSTPGGRFARRPRSWLSTCCRKSARSSGVAMLRGSWTARSEVTSANRHLVPPRSAARTLRNAISPRCCRPGRLRWTALPAGCRPTGPARRAASPTP